MCSGVMTYKSTVLLLFRFDDLNKVLQKIPATVNSGDALEKAGDELYDVFLERLVRANFG